MGKREEIVVILLLMFYYDYIDQLELELDQNIDEQLDGKGIQP